MADPNQLNVLLKALAARPKAPITVLRQDVEPIFGLLERLVSKDKAREITIQAFKDIEQLPRWVANSAHSLLLCRAVELAVESHALNVPGPEPSIANNRIEEALQQSSLRHRVALLARWRGWSLVDVAAALKVEVKTAKDLHREALKRVRKAAATTTAPTPSREEIHGPIPIARRD